jgi:ankyrin repeat protein
MSYDATLGRFTTVCHREGNIPEIRITVDPEETRRRQQTIERWSRLEQQYQQSHPHAAPFVVACQLGNLQHVRAAILAKLAAGLDVTAMVNLKGQSIDGVMIAPLMAAVFLERIPIVEILLEYNADPATTIRGGRNALYVAALRNTTTTITKKLLDNMQLEDINKIDIKGRTPLDVCYDNDESPIREELIDLIRLKGGKRQWELAYESAKGTVNEKYKQVFPGGTPLVVACEKGRVEDVVKMILDALAARMDVTAMVNEIGTDSCGDSGYTPLMIAAYFKHSMIVKILLQNGADTAINNEYKNNALHYAVWDNETETTTTIVKLLLDNMKLEDINQIDEDGDTPLDLCYKSDESSIREQLINLIRQKGGKQAEELLKRDSNSDGGSNKSQKTQLYLTSSNLKF